MIPAEQHGSLRCQRHQTGCTIAVPPLGLAPAWPDALMCLGLSSGLTALAGLALYKLTRVTRWLDWNAWLAGLCLCVLVLRPLSLLVNRRLLERALGRGKLIVEGQQLHVLWSVLWPPTRMSWEALEIVAIDEEEGALCILAEGKLTPLCRGRDSAELRWLAETLRQALVVPADPPGLDGEILVSYRLSDWSVPQRGYASVAPGELKLRPRFRLDRGLTLRPAGKPGPWRDSLGAGSLRIGPDDLRWGISEGGLPVLRIWLVEEESPEPVTLEIASPHIEELRERLEHFWS